MHILAYGEHYRLDTLFTVTPVGVTVHVPLGA